MLETLETNTKEVLEKQMPGEKSRHELEKEMAMLSPSIGGGKENAEEEDVKLQRENYNKDGITDVAVDKSLQKITFTYKNKKIEYEAGDGIETIYIESDKKKLYDGFAFSNSLFRANIAEPKKEPNHKEMLLQRLDLCLNAQNTIEQKLEKQGMQLAKEFLYMRGPKGDENKVEFAAQTLNPTKEKIVGKKQTFAFDIKTETIKALEKKL